MCGGGGGGSGTVQEVDTTTTTTPDPFLREIQQRFLSSFPTYPSGALVAPLAPPSLLANRMVSSFATDPRTYSSTPLADASAAYATSPVVSETVGNQLRTLNTISSAENLDPRSNPFTAAAADAANRQTVGTLVNDVFPRIRDSSVSAGQFGGSRQAISEANAVAGAAQAIADTTSKYFFGQYNQNVANAISAAAQTPATLLLPQTAISGAINDRNAANQQALMAIDALDKAGLQLQGQAQNEIDAEIQKFLFNNTFPLEVLRSVGGLTAGGTVHQTGTTTGPLPGISPLQGAVGGGLAGLSLGSTLSGSAMMSSHALPWLAVGGAALGLFSSF